MTANNYLNDLNFKKLLEGFKAHKISLHNVFTKRDGTTQQKLQVINNLSLLFKILFLNYVKKGKFI